MNVTLSSSAGGVQLPDSTTPLMGKHPSSGGIHEELDVYVVENHMGENGLSAEEE